VVYAKEKSGKVPHIGWHERPIASSELYAKYLERKRVVWMKTYTVGSQSSKHFGTKGCLDK